MVKKEALSSDLKFIKEVEELKIKQKLLIESLKRKNSDEQNKLFLEINSKLDFLVNIFNEANKSEEETDSEESNDNKFAPILEKLDEMNENINQKFSEIELKISTQQENKQTEKDEFKDKEEEIPPPVEENPKTDNQNKEEGKTTPKTEAPKPNFESKIEGDEKNETKKKKKWF